ncbi:sulfurtransferase TusA family protein, partial [Streptomyces sp. 8L]|uniref:sulfurtransferase TusA family protein n=1 Tax=Streptomyces sp. 8L TaxID=2877242 RepID=UPI001CD73FB9
GAEPASETPGGGGEPEPAEAPGEPGSAGEPDAMVVNALGKRCPIPVIELAKVFGRVPVGGTVAVLSDDAAARLDIPAWCEMRGQEYAGERPADGGVAYLVRRLS